MIPDDGLGDIRFLRRPLLPIDDERSHGVYLALSESGNK